MGARINQDEFLKRAKQRFGDQYTYEGMIWRSYKSPVKIRCTHHPVQDINITPETVSYTHLTLPTKRIV